MRVSIHLQGTPGVEPGPFLFTDDGRLGRLGHMMFGLSAFSLFLLAAQVSSTGGGAVTGRVEDAISSLEHRSVAHA
jgi:hypothetical protein